jgi:DNA repair exonuclease SbcCD ATPase subunit
MSIKIKNLTVKNFMSVGNITQAVDFEKEQLTLVLGENLDMGGDDNGSRNGTGKTTIVNALSYALFGQALTNIKKDNLINNINQKNMLVTVNFERNGVDYKIERGRKPNILKFFINDQEVDSDDQDESQGDSRKTQETIFDTINMTHTMFKHIIALNTYTDAFLSLKASDQREVIEQLLGITVLSEKAETLKEEIKVSKEAITQENAIIEATKSSNDRIKNTIESLELKQKAWYNKHEDDIEKVNQAIRYLESVDIEKEISLHDELRDWLDKNQQLKNLTREKSTLDTSISQSQKSVDRYSKELEKIQDHSCHACGQKLHDSKKEEMLLKINKDLSDSQTHLNKLELSLKEINNKISTIGDLVGKPNTFYEKVEDAYEHKNNLENLRVQLTSKLEEVDPYQEQIEDLQKTAIQEINWENINKLTKLKDHQEFLLKLLTNKDSFIRKKIIDQNLAYLNQRLTYYLDKSGLPHQVIFQNDLQVEITQLGQDLDFDNLSRGERNRLILSLSWAFRDMWENLYEPINLLFIDELIDSGMDAAGVENALAVLKKMARERNKNIYLISHKEELIGRVNNVLRVIKENSFTAYANSIDTYE